MKKINSSSILLTAGVLMFLVGISVTYDKSKAVAYDNQYKEKYEVTKWRVLRNPLDLTDPTNDNRHECLQLGPAEWKVTGSFGDGDSICSSGETCFEETWSVPTTAWHESAQYIGVDPGNVFVTVEQSTGNDVTANSLNCSIPFIEGDNKLFFNDIWHTYQAGLYGGYAAHKQRSGLATDESVGFHSWPKEWSISGSVGAP